MDDQPRRWRLNEDEIAARIIDGEAIMINLGNGMYYSLAGVGSFVWARLVRGESLHEVTVALTGEFDVLAEPARADLERLVGELVNEQLLLPAASDLFLEPPPEDDRPAGHRQAYAPPTLEVYSEFGGLLATDPPLPRRRELTW